MLKRGLYSSKWDIAGQVHFTFYDREIEKEMSLVKKLKMNQSYKELNKGL